MAAAKWVIIGLAFCFTSQTTTAVDPSGIIPLRPKLDPTFIDAEVKRALEYWKAPGLAIVVVAEDKVIYAKGFGLTSIGGKEPVTEDTLFPLASCSKAFTSSLIAAMVDDRQMDWDDSVRKHLPTFHISEEHADKLVSIRDLLTHRTGVGGHDLIWYRAPWDRNEVIRRIAKLPMSAPFRGGYQYSSLMFTAAGEAAANRAGKPWDELVREKLTTPLGMKNVAFSTAQAAKFKDRAAGHRLDDKGKVVPMEEYEIRDPDGAGSVYTTARDLGSWLRMHLNQGKLGGKRIVSAENLAETHEPHTPIRRNTTAMFNTYPKATQVSYAMGWVVYDYENIRVVGHGGMIDGFRSQITLLPDHNIGFALLTNLHDTKMNLALAHQFLQKLANHASAPPFPLPPHAVVPSTLKDMTDELRWHDHFRKAAEQEAKEAADEKKQRLGERDPKSPPSLPLEKYVGEYANPAYGISKIELKDGVLTWKWSSFAAPLELHDGDRFRVVSGYFEGEPLAFRIDGVAPKRLSIRGIAYDRR